MTKQIFLPAHTRTIHIELQSVHFPLYNDKDIIKHFDKLTKIYKPYKINSTCLFFRYKLNLPDFMLATENGYGIAEPYSIENNEIQTYYSPLLNTDNDGNVCMGQAATNDLDIFKNNFFNSYFNFGMIESMAHYCKIEWGTTLFYYEFILDFYQNWQNTGKLKLIKS